MKKHLKICLFLPPFSNPDMFISSLEIHINYLSRLGHEISLITSNKYNNPEETKNIFYYVPYHFKKSLFKKTMHFLRFRYNRIRLALKIFRNNSFDIIEVRNDVFDGLLAIYLKKKYNIPFVFRYTFPKSAYKHRKQKKIDVMLLGTVEEFLLNFILKKADFIFPISESMQEELVNKGIKKSKMQPIPMGVNIDSFKEKNSGKILKKYNLAGNTIILYIGNLNPLRNLQIIICAFSNVRNHFKDIKLLIIGDGEDKQNLEKLCDDLKIKDDVIFTGPVPHSEIPSYIYISNICLSPVPPIDIYKISSPTKLFEYLALSKPVVANKEILEHDYVLRKSEAGALVDFTCNGFYKGIIDMLNNKDLNKMGQNGHSWLLNNRTYQKLAYIVEAKYYHILKINK